jgi:hypothetical protein
VLLDVVNLVENPTVELSCLDILQLMDFAQRSLPILNAHVPEDGQLLFDPDRVHESLVRRMGDLVAGPADGHDASDEELF